jgi:hypothetical protein
MGARGDESKGFMGRCPAAGTKSEVKVKGGI